MNTEKSNTENTSNELYTLLCGVITDNDLHKAIDWIGAEIKHLETKQTRTQFEEGQLYELKILKQWIR